MIEFIRGKVASKSGEGGTHLIIDVGGVGLGVEVSARTAEKLPAVGETVGLPAYLQVREDALDLYGFSDAAEKTMFLKLIGVSGIGPRLALRILSSATPARLAASILEGDVRALTALKGVGKKTAEVLIASLRAAVSKMALSTDPESAPGIPAPGGPLRDAMRALVALGVKEIQAQEAVQKAARKLGEGAETGRLIAQALQEV
jgi:Holliday junction DNA helicase RuvA